MVPHQTFTYYTHMESESYSAGKEIHFYSAEVGLEIQGGFPGVEAFCIARWRAGFHAPDTH